MAITVPGNKILISIGFWKGDRALAMKLVRLLADLETNHCEIADLLLVSRFDCEHHLDTVKYASRKFNVSTYVSRRRAVGWPHGCNSLFFGGLDYIYHMKSAKKIPAYKAILNLGADGAPLRKDWISHLSSEWDRVNEAGPVSVAGALLKDPDPHGNHWHVNGDACFLTGDLDFLKWLAKDVCDVTATGGWDWVMASEFEKRGWANIPAIKSLWRFPPPFPEARWEAENQAGTAWIHGVKSDDLLYLTRKKLL